MSKRTINYDKLDELTYKKELLQDDGGVIFGDSTVRITFVVPEDDVNRIVSLSYANDSDTAELMCLLYELAEWAGADRKQRTKLSAVLKQYEKTLPTPILQIQSYV
jgi:hypothetical protein